jgi:hypothetical protein
MSDMASALVQPVALQVLDLMSTNAYLLDLCLRLKELVDELNQDQKFALHQDLHPEVALQYLEQDVNHQPSLEQLRQELYLLVRFGRDKECDQEQLKNLDPARELHRKLLAQIFHQPLQQLLPSANLYILRFLLRRDMYQHDFRRHVRQRRNCPPVMQILHQQVRHFVQTILR